MLYTNQMKKIRSLTEGHLNSFISIRQSMNSLATLPMPGTFLQELKDSGINERGTPRNQLVGCVVTQPSGSQMAIETVFYDTRDLQDDGDLHVVNFEDKTITSFHRGWGTWEEYYGNQHHTYKSYLRFGTSSEIK